MIYLFLFLAKVCYSRIIFIKHKNEPGLKLLIYMNFLLIEIWQLHGGEAHRLIINTMVVGSIPTVALNSSTQHAMLREFSWRWEINILMGTECLNTTLSGSLCLPCYIRDTVVKLKKTKKIAYLSLISFQQ